MNGTLFIIVFLAFGLIVGPTSIQAQSKRRQSKSPAQLAKEAASIKADLIEKIKQVKTEVHNELQYLKLRVKEATEDLENNKKLVELGLVAKQTVEEKENALKTAQDKVNDKQKEIVEADNLIAEVRAAEQLAKFPVRVGGYRMTSALIRYNGPAAWFLTDAAKVQGFFSQKFGRGLPVSAFGQTATHDRLGFDHRNAIDVAVHPDTAEGQSLMAYLRGAGIPFIAFRQAVAGSATGPHIHIGHPSRRIR